MLSVHAQKVLCVAQDVPKVNVEQVPCKVRETKAFHSSSGDLHNLHRLLMPSRWAAYTCICARISSTSWFAIW